MQLFCPNAVVWGDVATWASAIGTFAAVVIALALAFRQEWEKARDREARKRSAALQLLPLVDAWRDRVNQAHKHLTEAVEGTDALTAMKIPEVPIALRPDPTLLAWADRFGDIGEAGPELSEIIFDASELARDFEFFPLQRGHGRPEETHEDWVRIAEHAIESVHQTGGALGEVRRLLRLSLGQYP
jgi:hypothetical protein